MKRKFLLIGGCIIAVGLFAAFTPLVDSVEQTLGGHHVEQWLHIGESSYSYTGVPPGQGSIMSGKESIASGTNSVALGDFAKATGDSSFALGDNSSALGQGSLSFGRNSTADSFGYGWSPALAFGGYAKAEGLSTIAIGPWASSRFNVGNLTADRGDWGIWNSYGAMAIGAGASSGGYASTAVGRYSNASDDYSIGIGFNGRANANKSLAIGYSASANGIDSIAIGRDVTSFGKGTVTIGRFNHSGSASWNLPKTDVHPDNHFFVIGNGTDWGNRSNSLEMTHSGETTLINNNWRALSDKLDDTGGDNKALIVEGHTELKGQVIMSEPQGDIAMGIFAP